MQTPNPNTPSSGIAGHAVAVMAYSEQWGTSSALLARNLARGGLLVQSPWGVAEGQEIAIALSAEQFPDVVSVKSIAVRAIRTPTGEVYGVGFRFAPLGEWEQAILENWVREPGDAGPNAEPEAHEITPPRGTEATALPHFSISEEGQEQGVRLDAIPSLRSGAARNQQLYPALVHLLTYINGKRSVADISKQTGLPYADVISGMTDLFHRGLIDLAGVGSKLPTSRAATPTGDITDSHPVAPEAAPPVDEPQGPRLLRTRMRNYLARSVAAERAGQIPEAVRLLELALALNPPAPCEMHVRLARLALDHLSDTDLAQLHADAALASEPNNVKAQDLVREIARGQLVGNPKKGDIGGPAMEAPADKAPIADLAPPPPRRTEHVPAWKKALFLVAALVSIGLFANLGLFLVRYYDVGAKKPEEIPLTSVSDLIPSTSVKLADSTIIVTTTVAWDTLDKADKEKRLFELYGRLSLNHANVNTLLVYDQAPLLVGKVAGGKAKVYR